MALVRWDPTRELDTLQSDMNRLFDGFFGRREGTRNGYAPQRWVPAMDLVETDEHLVLRADLPGVDGDDIDIEVKDGVLTVSGERKAEHEEKGEASTASSAPSGASPALLTCLVASERRRCRQASTVASSR